MNSDDNHCNKLKVNYFKTYYFLALSLFRFTTFLQGLVRIQIKQMKKEVAFKRRESLLG
jgi:hypothetical protein